jgi:hypothetical protein
MSISQLTKRPDKGPDLSAEAVASLDERILAMRKLLAIVADRFPVQKPIMCDG